MGSGREIINMDFSFSVCQNVWPRENSWRVETKERRLEEDTWSDRQM